MRTFLSNIRPYSRLRPDAKRAAAAPTRPGSQDGFTLIEVIVSSLMVGLIVVGTFSGFQVADQSSAQERLHDEASVLAAQSQDQLRSAPASALGLLATAPHTYTQVADGVTFTIKQEARFVGGPEGNAGCSVTEHKSQITNALRITSTVSWVHANTNALPVVESSVVTPPTGSALEVDVGNAPAPTEGVSGVLVVVKYTAVGSSGVSTIEGTTEKAGCLVFGAIPSTSATVEIPEQTGFVTINGSQHISPVEVTLAPNTTTYHQVTYNRGATATAEFTYNKLTKYHHTNNKNESEEEPVTGDTFIATSSGMKLPPNYEVGSTRGEVATSGLFEPLPGIPASPSWYKTQSNSPQATNYPTGNLFPFPESEGEGGWRVYAGDCTANDPEALAVPEVTVERKWLTAAKSTVFQVPLSRVALNVYKGSESEVNALGAKAAENLETGAALKATIINTKCTGGTPIPDNETEGSLSNVHMQETTTGPANGGHLEAPFQPFGEYELCLYEKIAQKTFTVTGKDLTIAGSSQNIFLKQRSPTEREEEKIKAEKTEKATEEKRAKEEKESKEKREEKEVVTDKPRVEEEKAEQKTRETLEAAQKTWEKEEATQKTKRESEEATKATRLAKEKSERETWATEEKNQEKKGKHLKPNLAEKEATQTTARKTLEATEKTAEEKRKAEEAATKATRTKDEATKETLVKEEKATETTRHAQETAKTTAEKEEAETIWNPRKKEEAATKEKREAREAEEAKEGTKITVKSKQSGCPT
jgi:prepilin-type N-terminal cleavage/methylation domain-containing protein